MARIKIAGVALAELKDQAKAHHDRNKALAGRLSEVTPPDLDNTIHSAHRKQFANIECLDCANCCKTTPALLVQEDMERIARRLAITVSDFIEAYVIMDEDGDFVTNRTPCPFLRVDNYCDIYDVRPQSCREYPLTLRTGQAAILDITLANTEVCPAVFRIFEKLSQIYNAGK